MNTEQWNVILNLDVPVSDCLLCR